MDWNRFLKGAVLFLAASFCLHAAPPPVELPRQYSAEIESTVAGQTSVMKLWIDGNKHRMEVTGSGMDAIVITRGDRKVTYTLMPAQKQYMELPMSTDQVTKSDPTAIDPGAKWESLGTETVNGKLCDKYRVTTDKGENLKKIVSLLYFDAATKEPVQVIVGEGAEAVLVKYKKFQSGSPDASLFEVPAGYEKFAMPAMPPNTMSQ